MRYFFDTEFHEDGKTIDLISIGIAAEDGRELYLENVEYDKSRADEWLRENVLTQLIGSYVDVSRTRNQIRDAVLAFVGKDHKPEFWAYYADYDWVVLCQLFGRMIDLPKHFPMWCRDLKQLSWSLGSPKHRAQKSGNHNALADACWNLELYKYLQSLQSNRL